MPTSASIAAARDLGLSIEQLIERASHAARLTHPRANRRHRDLCFLVEDGTILGVWKLDDDARHTRIPVGRDMPVLAHPSANTRPIGRRLLSWDCPVCEGEMGFRNCTECRGSGKVERTEDDYRRLCQEIGVPF